MHEFEGWEDDEQEAVICPFCEARGYIVLLGPRILMPGQIRDESYDQFLECPTCTEVIPLHEIPQQEEIKNAIETIESPFEQGKIIAETVFKKRSSPAGKKLSEKKRKSKIKFDSDKEINELVRIYGEDNVKVHQ